LKLIIIFCYPFFLNSLKNRDYIEPVEESSNILLKTFAISSVSLGSVMSSIAAKAIYCEEELPEALEFLSQRISSKDLLTVSLATTAVGFAICFFVFTSDNEDSNNVETKLKSKSKKKTDKKVPRSETTTKITALPAEI